MYVISYNRLSASVNFACLACFSWQTTRQISVILSMVSSHRDNFFLCSLGNVSFRFAYSTTFVFRYNNNCCGRTLRLLRLLMVRACYSSLYQWRIDACLSRFNLAGPPFETRCAPLIYVSRCLPISFLFASLCCCMYVLFLSFQSLPPHSPVIPYQV